MSTSDQSGARILDMERALHARLAEAASLLLRHAEGLTPETRQVLYDVERGTRSRFKTLAVLLDLSARCADPSVRLLVPEVCRGAVVMATPMAAEPCVLDSFRAETDAQGAADVAQLEHVAQRQPHTADAALRTLLGHHEAIRSAMDALHSDRARLAAPRSLTASPPAWHARREAQPALVGAARRAP